MLASRVASALTASSVQFVACGTLHVAGEHKGAQSGSYGLGPSVSHAPKSPGTNPPLALPAGYKHTFSIWSTSIERHVHQDRFATWTTRFPMHRRRLARASVTLVLRRFDRQGRSIAYPPRMVTGLRHCTHTWCVGIISVCGGTVWPTSGPPPPHAVV